MVAIFTDRLLRGEPCIINGDGLQTRDYVYVGDVAEAVRLALDRTEVTGPVNIGTGIETSVVTLLERLRTAAGIHGEARHGPARPGEQRRSLLDARRAREELGWTPRVTLDEGLRRTVAARRGARLRTGLARILAESEGVLADQNAMNVVHSFHDLQVLRVPEETADRVLLRRPVRPVDLDRV